MSEFQPGLAIRIGNRVVTPLLRAGLPIGPMALITVTGRRSGLPRTTPIALAPHQRGWRLVAPFGVVDWVKNLRQAGTAQVTRRRRTFEVRAFELTPKEAAPLLRESLIEVGPITRSVVGGQFDVALDAPLADWVAEAHRHPVFILEPIERRDPSRKT